MSPRIFLSNCWQARLSQIDFEKRARMSGWNAARLAREEALLTYEMTNRRTP